MTLISNVMFVAGGRIASLACSALLGILTARVLGPLGRGVYALPLLDAGLAVTFAAGLGTATSYFLLNRSAGRDILRSAACAVLVCALVGTLPTIITALFSRSVWAIWPATVYIGLYATYSVTCGYFIGRDRVRTTAILNVAMSCVSLLLMVLVLGFLSASPSAAIVALLSSSALVAAGGLIAALCDARCLNGESVDVKAFMLFIVRSGGLNLLNLLNYRIDTYIVAALAPLSILGLYTVAVAGAESALSVAYAVIQVASPRIARQSRTDADMFAARCIRNSLFLTSILCALAMIVTGPTVSLLFGHAYISIVSPLRVLLLGVVVVPIGGLISNFFMLNRGRASVPIATATVSALLCGIISSVLVPKLGMLGAAIGSTVAYTASQFVAVSCFCSETGQSPMKVLVIDRSDAAMYRRILSRGKVA